jgi:hypothetical protein
MTGVLYQWADGIKEVYFCGIKVKSRPYPVALLTGVPRGSENTMMRVALRIFF